MRFNGMVAKYVTPQPLAWWRHQMETFSTLLALCEDPSQRPVTIWSAPEQTIELTIETPVIRDAIALIMTSPSL